MKKFLISVGMVLALLGSTILQTRAQQNLPMPIFLYDMANIPNGTFTDISSAAGAVALGTDMADNTDLKNKFFVATSESDATPTTLSSTTNSTTLNMPAFPLGFTFDFAGTPVDHFIVNSIGGVLFCSTASHMASNCFAYNAAAGNQSVLNLPYLSSTAGGDPSSQVPAGRVIKYNGKAPAYYLISGTEGNHVLTVQHNYYTKSADYDEWLFQYKFYEATGVIEWIIGKFEVDGAYLSTSNPTRYPKRHRIGMALTSFGAKPNPDYYAAAYLNIPAPSANNIYRRSAIQNNSTIVPLYGWDSVALGDMPTTGMFIEASKPEEGRTFRFSPPAPCSDANASALTAADYDYTEPANGGLSTGSTYTSTIRYKMCPLDEYCRKGTIVAVLSASETPDYTLPNGTIVYANDELGEGTGGVKPTVLCNKSAAITPNVAANTFTWKANTTSAKTNEITLTVNGITAGVTRYIHLYRMVYSCSGGPVYSPLCHTIVLQKPLDAPQSLEIAGLPTINSVPLKAKAADGLKVMVVKTSTLNVKPSGVLNVGDNIGSDAKVVALFAGEQTFTAQLNPEEKCNFIAFSVNTDNPNSYAYSSFNVKDEHLWVRARAAYNGLPGRLDMSKEQHGTPNTAYNGFNTKSLDWQTLEPTLYRDLPFGWTRDIVNTKKNQGFGLGKTGYATSASVSLYALCSYNETTQMDAITAPILVDKGRILVTYEMQLYQNSDDGITKASAQANDQFAIQYAIGNSNTWTNLASWTGSNLPATDSRDVYKLTATLSNNDLVGQYVRFRFMVNGASTRTNTSTYVAINTLEIKEDKICQPPTNLQQVITQTTTTQMGLTWNDGNKAPTAATSYVVAYKRADAAGDWATKTVNTNSITLTGLRNANTYLVRMNAVCGADGDSYQTDTATFSTAYTFPYDEPMAQLDTLLMIQGSRAQIPYYSPFAGKAMTPAITRRDGGVSTATGSLPNSGNASLSYSKGDGSDRSVFSHSETVNKKNNVKKADGFRTLLESVGVCEMATQAWLVTPVIYTVNLEGDEPLVVRFKARSSSKVGTAGNYTVGSVGSAFSSTTLKVLVSNTGNFSSANVIGTVDVGTETLDGTEFEFELPTPLTGTVQVAFYYNNPNSTTSEDNTNYMTFEIFDVKYEYKEDVALCPALEGLERTYLMPNSATFEWGASEYAAYYEVEYGPMDEDGYAFTSPHLTEPEYKLTGLDEQTTYKIRVTAYCDEDGEKAAPDPLEDVFTTPEGCHTPTSFKVDDITYYGATFTSTQNQAILLEREVRVQSAADEDGFLKVFKQSADALVLDKGLYDDMSYIAQTRAICRYGEASRDTSDWSSSRTFTTPLDPANAPDTFNIQVFADPIEGGSVTGAGRYFEDDVVTMKATPNEGYRFVEWSCATHGNAISTNATLSMRMKTDENTTAKTHDSTYTAKFIKIYVIEAQTNDVTFGTVTGAGTYDDGKEVTLTATPKTNYVFEEWVNAKGDHVSTNATYKFTPTANASFTAVFREKRYYSLDVAVTPNDDWGSVAISPQANEDDQYQEGREVTLTATAAQYCKFVSWQDADGKVLGTDPTYKMTMAGEKTVLAIKAVFAQIRYNVTLVSNPSKDYGTINGTSGSQSDGGNFAAGTTRRLEAKPKSGYEFVKWMGGTTELGTNPVLEFVLTKDTTITAYFKEKENLTVTVNIEPANAGTVTGAGQVKRNNSVTLTATAAEHYAFKEWRRVNNTTVSANPYTFTPDRDYTFTAVFRALENYLITTTYQGQGSVSGGGTYEEGASVTVTATAGAGYNFAEWQDAAGNTVSTDATYTFTATESLTLKAIFTEDAKYMVTLTRLPNSAAGTTTGAGEYAAGESVTISASPAKGYEFVEWQNAGNTTVSTNNPYTFDMPGNNVSYKAVFRALCEIKVTVDPSGAGTVTGAGTYNQNDEVTLEATVDESYVFVGWQSAVGSTLSTDNPWTFNASESQNITAKFREKGFFSIDVPCLGGAEDEDDLGTVSIPGDDEGEWMEGETVSMTAQPNQYCKFVEWRDKNGNKLSENPTYTFVISKDTLFYAVFAHIQYTVTLVSNPSKDYGTINGTSGSPSDGGKFNAGTKRRLEAKPKSGYVFEKWMSGTTELGTNPVYEFILTQDITITAYFKQKESLTVTINVDPSTAGSVTGAGTIQRGVDAVLTATANAGYKFMYWERIDGTQHEANPYTLKNPQRDYTFTAKFRVKEQYNINVAIAPYTSAGTITRSGFLANGKAEEDATVSLTANPAEGYRFVEWQDATGKQVGTEATLSLTATANATYKAVFEEIPEQEYTVTVNIVPENGGRIYNDGTHPAGKEVTLRARPNAKYTFEGWYDATGTTKLAADTLYKITITEDVTYTAKFELKPTVDVKVTVRLGETVDATVGTVTGAGTYDKGKTVTLTATPASADYLFSGWRDLDNDDELVGSANPFTFEASDNVNYAAVFREKFEVTLNILPDENAGTVTGAGPGRQGYPRTITAEPSEGYRFLGWLNAAGNMVTTETSYTFVLEEDVTFTAKFEVENENEFNITVKRMPNNDAGTVKGNGRYALGEQATLTATAATNYLFVGWLKPKADDPAKFDTIKNNPYHFVVEGDASFTALFRSRARYMIDVDILPNDDAGTVTGDGEVREGRTVNLEASANEGYVFVAWVNPALPAPRDTVSRLETYTFVAQGNASFKAIFRRTAANYTLTLNVSPAIAGTVTGGGVFRANSTVTITATPNAGYKFIGWRNDATGRTVSTEPSYQFPITGDVTYTALFRKNDIMTVTLNVTPEGAGTVTGAGEYPVYAEATVTATANRGYRFVEWQDAAGKTLSTEAAYTFMVNADVNYTAVFEESDLETFTVKTGILPSGSAAGTATGDGQYVEGTMATVIATANPGYRFLKWVDDKGETLSTEATYTFEVVADITCWAMFESTGSGEEEVVIIVLRTLPNNEAGTVTGAGKYNKGDRVTIVAEAAANYTFVGWYNADGDMVSTNPTFTFTAEISTSYTAQFKENTANEQQLKAAFNVAAGNGRLFIENLNGVVVREVTVFNTVGRQLAHFTPNSNSNLALPVDARYAILVVRVISEQGMATYKVYLH